MNEWTQRRLDKAERSVHAAELMLTGGDADFAAGRAYYAMFYAAEALLHDRGLRFRKHAGVHAAFAQYFAKTGLVAPKFHRWLVTAFGKRIERDYGLEGTVTPEDAARTIEQAREFIR